VSRYQKGKTNLDFTEARDSEWQWHQVGRMQVCTSLQTDNHASTTPLKVFYRPDALPAAQPTASKPSVLLPSVLLRCWLGGRKGIRPVKTEWWVICLERGADMHMAQLMPLPLIVSSFSKIQIGFTFLVLAHPGSPGKRAVKRVYVCMYVTHFCLSFSCWCSAHNNYTTGNRSW